MKLKKDFALRKFMGTWVVMAVGEEHGAGRASFGLRRAQDTAALVTGIDDGADAGALVAQQVAVGLQLTYGDGDDLHAVLLTVDRCLLPA